MRRSSNSICTGKIGDLFASSLIIKKSSYFWLLTSFSLLLGRIFCVIRISSQLKYFFFFSEVQYEDVYFPTFLFRTLFSSQVLLQKYCAIVVLVRIKEQKKLGPFLSKMKICRNSIFQQSCQKAGDIDFLHSLKMYIHNLGKDRAQQCCQKQNKHEKN